MRYWLKSWWCALTHGGGSIVRDDLGRINWQCAACGRYSDPVPLDEDRRVVDRHIASARLGKAE